MPDTGPIEWVFRPLTANDQDFLWEMCYQAIHVPPGEPAPDRSILLQPRIAGYAQDWGRPGDLGVVGVDLRTDRPVGAAWLRLWSGEPHGYGFVDEKTPELSIAVLPGARGQGLGSALLRHLLALADERHLTLSLSVSPDNPALNLYRRFGFVVVGSEGSSLTMLRRGPRTP